MGKFKIVTVYGNKNDLIFFDKIPLNRDRYSYGIIESSKSEKVTESESKFDHKRIFMILTFKDSTQLNFPHQFEYKIEEYDKGKYSLSDSSNNKDLKTRINEQYSEIARRKGLKCSPFNLETKTSILICQGDILKLQSMECLFKMCEYEGGMIFKKNYFN